MNKRKKLVYKQLIMLSLGFLLIMVFVGMAQQIGARNSEESFQRLQYVITQNNKKFVLLTTMREVIRTRLLALYDLTLNSGDAFELDEKVMSFSEMSSDFIVARDALLKLELTKKQREQLESQKVAIRKSQYIFNVVLAEAQLGNNVVAATKVTEARAANQVVLQGLNDLRDEQLLLAKLELKSSKKSYENAKYKISVLTISAFILSLGVIGFVIHRIIMQAVNLNNALDSLAKSNLNLEDKVIEKTELLMISQRDNMRLSAEVDVSRKLQKILLPLPEELKNIKPLDVSAYMQPADEVGGDYYDVLQAGNRLRIGIGDVTGHGLESGIVMLMAQCLVQAIFYQKECGLKDVLNITNQTVYKNVKRMECEKSMSLVLLDYELVKNNEQMQGKITVSGQHESIIIVRENGTVENVETDQLGFPIGLIEDIKEFINETTIVINKGDVVVLYTDGITEAADPDQNLFGLEALQNVIKNNHTQSSFEIKDAILNELRAHIKNQVIYDDITMVVLKQR